MLHNAVSDPLHPSSRSRLSWRSPSVKNDPGCEVHRYPATTVLLPAQLHSDSCNSIFSSWDIEREEGRAASERRAPLAHFRRSYILSDCKDPDYHQPPSQPPVTLSLRQVLSSEIFILSPLDIIYPELFLMSSSVPSSSFIQTPTQCLLRTPLKLYKAVHAHLFTVNSQKQKSEKPTEPGVTVKKHISGQNKIQSNKKNFPIKNLIADKASLIIHRKTSRNGKARFHLSKSISL